MSTAVSADLRVGGFRVAQIEKQGVRFWLWGFGCPRDAWDMKDCVRIIRVRPMVSFEVGGPEP